MASNIFENIVASALRVGNKAPSQNAIIQEATSRKGLDLRATMSLRAEDDLSEEDTKAFEKSVDQYVDDLMEGLFRRNINAIIDTSERKGKKTKIKVTAVYGLRDRAGRAISALSLTRLLNLTLYKYAQELMGKNGRLVNRTGRLAHSGVITNISQQKPGTVSIYFKYMLYPYEVFEPGGKMGTANRSPSQLFTDATNNALRDILNPSSATQIIRWAR